MRGLPQSRDPLDRSTPTGSARWLAWRAGRRRSGSPRCSRNGIGLLPGRAHYEHGARRPGTTPNRALIRVTLQTMMPPSAGSRPIPCANPSCRRPFYPNRADAAFCSVPCRLAEVTDRSGNPLGWIDVEGQIEPCSGVALIARIPDAKGQLRDPMRVA
jgi:hypothetical protein